MNYENINKGNGFLGLIFAPMFAGKTTKLMSLYYDYQNYMNEDNIFIIDYYGNNRYQEVGTGLISHDKKHIEKCLKLKTLKEFEDSEDFQKAQVILIDELQFFSDAYSVIVNWIDLHKKKVICAGLSGDFLRKPFGDMLTLIPHADEIIKLNAECKYCNNNSPAIFTRRKFDNVNSLDQILIGSSEYEPVCRKHYLEA